MEDREGRTITREMYIGQSNSALRGANILANYEHDVGAIVIDESARDETSDLTTAEMDKLAGDEKPVEHLPELKSGDILVGKKGYRYRVRRINKPRRDTGFQEPLFRLSKITEIYIEGNMEFTLDELQNAGMKLEV